MDLTRGSTWPARPLAVPFALPLHPRVPLDSAAKRGFGSLLSDTVAHGPHDHPRNHPRAPSPFTPPLGTRSSSAGVPMGTSLRRGGIGPWQTRRCPSGGSSLRQRSWWHRAYATPPLHLIGYVGRFSLCARSLLSASVPYSREGGRKGRVNDKRAMFVIAY